MRLRCERTDHDVGAQLFEARFRDAADREQIVDAAELAAFLAELDDVVCCDGADARELLELLDGCGIQINRLCGRFLLRGRNRCASGAK